MREIISTITSKGQITLPAKVRRHLGLDAKDKVAFVIGEDGGVQVRPIAYPTIASLRGAAGSLPRPMTWEQMLDVAREDQLASEYPSRE